MEYKKVENVELEMMVDEVKRTQPYVIQNIQIEAKTYFARFEALKAEGFTPEQALEIVKARGLT